MMKRYCLCFKDEYLEEVFSKAAIQLDISIQIHDSIKDVLEDTSWDYVLVDLNNEDIQDLINKLLKKDRNPRKEIIRIIQNTWTQYFFHDMAVFATIVRPQDENEAAFIIRKIEKAVNFLDKKSEEKTIGSYEVENWINASPDLKPVIETINKLAKKPVDILLTGETGSGKDMLAKYVHKMSSRKGKFVHINCAAIPDQLIESELFGVDAGAYTGATKSRPGKIELANNGTLYLDEIDSMSLTCQAKLLTALQERGVERLGGHIFIPSNFRVIASTKINLTELVEDGKFRQDLLFRIQVININIPALRERVRDIVSLFKMFCKELAERYEQTIPEIPYEINALIMTHQWPGNVRELKSAAERYVLGMPLSGVKNDGNEKKDGLLKYSLKQYETELIKTTLQNSKYVVSSAAKKLGISSHNLYYRMKQLGIKQDDKSLAKEN